MENWKPIKNYEDKYLISDHGNVKTLSRNIYRKCGKLHYKQPEKYLNPSLLPIGYRYIGLHIDGKIKLKTVHSLVAEHFIDNPNNLKTVNHKDGNKLNNHVSNLEWLSNADNLKHAFDTKLHKYASLFMYNQNTGERLFFNRVSDAVKIGFKQPSISSSVRKQNTYKGYRCYYIGEKKICFGSSAGSRQKDLIRK